MEPIGGSFDLTSVNPATLVLISPGTGSVSQIPAVSDKTLVIGDADNNEIADMRVCFRKEDLRLLFSNLTGKSTVTVTVGGDVLTGGNFRAPIQIDVIAPGGPLAASVSPNPLNPSATLAFLTTRAGFARVRLYDLSGRIVRSLMEEPALAPGLHALTIDGRAGDGRPLASGIYYFRIESAEGVEQGRFTLLK